MGTLKFYSFGSGLDLGKGKEVPNPHPTLVILKHLLLYKKL